MRYINNKLIFVGSLFVNSVLLILLIGLLKIDNVRVEIYKTLVMSFGQSDIVLLGDSITRRNSDFAMMLGGFNFNTINQGVDGYTIAQVDRKINDVIIPLNPCLVVLMAGTNRQAGDSVQQNTKLYRDLLVKLKKHSIDIVVLETILANKAPLNDYIKQLNEQMKKVTAEHHITYFPSNQFLSDGNRLLDEYTNDGIHLTSRGYDVLNEALLPFIKQHFVSPREQCNRIF
ncbi:MAG: SGNH/GDSL hydrolase family protein [Thalassotalea sp.]